MKNNRKIEVGQVWEARTSGTDNGWMYVILCVGGQGVDIMWLTGEDIDCKDYWLFEETECDVFVM